MTSHARCACASHSGAAPATVSESSQRHPPLCTRAREGAAAGVARPLAAGDRPLASPETGLGRTHWLRCGGHCGGDAGAAARSARSSFLLPRLPCRPQRARACALEKHRCSSAIPCRIAVALALPLSPPLAPCTTAQRPPPTSTRSSSPRTRTAITVDESLAAVEVIDRDADRTQPGAFAAGTAARPRRHQPRSTRAALGKLTTLFLRGTESDHALVLVDGVRVGSATSGLAALQDLPVATDRAHRDRARPALEPVRLRSDRRRDPDVHPPRPRRRHAAPARSAPAATACAKPAPASAAAAQRGWFGVDYRLPATDGINACRGAGFAVFAGCFIDEPDRDGYRNTRCRCAAASTLTDALTLEAHMRCAPKAHNDYDGDFADNSDDRAAGGRRQAALAAGRARRRCSSPPAATSTPPTTSSAARFIGYFDSRPRQRHAAGRLRHRRRTSC